MEISELRKPTQKRAIEKRDKILKYGFELMCEKGLYNTDATQIAKYSGVSTGTVYQYFKDKKDIFLQGLKLYAQDLMFPINDLKDKKLDKNNLSKEFRDIIDFSIKSHEEIIALQHTDKEVSKIFKQQEVEATKTLVEILENNNIVVNNIYERSHLILKWIDHLCHEITFHKHNNMDYSKMTDIVIDSIVNILK